MLSNACPDKAAIPINTNGKHLDTTHTLVLELQRQLQEATSALEERDRDLHLSAEIGQSLLLSNQQLKQDYEQLLCSSRPDYTTEVAALPPSQDGIHRLGSPLLPPTAGSVAAGSTFHTLSSVHSSALQLHSLESAHADLQARYESTLVDLQDSNDSGRQARASLKRLEIAHDALVSSVQTLSEDLEAAQQDKKRLAAERTEAHRQIQHLEATLSSYSDRDRGRATADHHAHLAMALEANAELTAERDHHAACGVDLQLQCNELHAMLEAERTYRDEAQMQEERAETLLIQLEASRDHVQFLTARLALLEPSLDTGEADLGSHTLLGEVEDRRMQLEGRHSQLEGQHSQLQSSHASLVQTHHVVQTQQQRMRRHMARLTQVAQSGQGSHSGNAHLVHLERALAQAQSELHDMTLRSARLERMLDSHNTNSSVALDGSDSALDGSESTPASTKTSSQVISDLHRVVATLRLQVEQGDSETADLRREIRTLLMVKNAETDRAAKLRNELAVQCGVAEQLRATCAQLTYELDSQQRDTGDPVGGLDACVGSADVQSIKSSRNDDGGGGSVSAANVPGDTDLSLQMETAATMITSEASTHIPSMSQIDAQHNVTEQPDPSPIISPSTIVGEHAASDKATVEHPIPDQTATASSLEAPHLPSLTSSVNPLSTLTQSGSTVRKSVVDRSKVNECPQQ
ncbi:hypothetical protein BSLG_000612 [Batrachochytrium salamandrivorans]|nr:hypothetical protein BSLG_000612 [Batrachochytrium salamandrivorans]